ncbi:MAG: MBL fold metallo-hydrolase [Nitrospira sp.]|nr:MBL fold metallo-hydrolase [Nitrospira sp.]
MLVHHLGHSFLAIEVDGNILLVDPILTHGSLRLRQPFVARWAWPELMDRICGVVVSHSHGDHLHPPSLLGLDPATTVFAFGEESCQQVTTLGFREVVDLNVQREISPVSGLDVKAIPAIDSADGVHQCILLFKFDGHIVLDAVDVRDTNELRSSLDGLRGHIDVAFLPAGTSVQWEGGWNQMDADAAVAFAAWLAPKRVALAGGAISMDGQPMLGFPERYPASLHSVIKAIAETLGSERIIVEPTPFSVDVSKFESPRICAFRPKHFTAASSPSRPQALATTFFSGHDPRIPLESLAQTNVAAWNAAWGEARETVRALGPQLALLNRRCPEANCTPAQALASRTITCLARGGDDGAIASILSLLPQGDDPNSLDVSFFAPAEAAIRSHPSEKIAEALLALEVDRALSLLRREEHVMRRRAAPSQAQADLRREHLDRLAQEMPARRPRLRSNHVLLGRDSAHLVATDHKQDTLAAVLIAASPSGIRSIGLDATELLILDLLDGRTGSDVSSALSEATGLPEDVTMSAVTTFVLRVEATMPAAIGWVS